MTASAGVAAAAHQELGAAVRSETGRAQAAIVIVGHDPGVREVLYRELSTRYGADYQIVVCYRPAERWEAFEWRDLRGRLGWRPRSAHPQKACRPWSSSMRPSAAKRGPAR